MKIAPVSGDLLVKLALFAAVGVGAWMLLQRAKAALPSWPAVPDWGQVGATLGGWVNPMSDQNLAYQGTTAAVSAAVGYEETLGGWLYDLTHPDPMAVVTPPYVPWEEGWPTGGSVTYPIGGSGGAAFGMYPRP